MPAHDPALSVDADAHRFAFGDNWLSYLSTLDGDRIEQAERSIRELLRVDTLAGKRFADIGCGSGLFSLAARRLGATVYSLDFDPQSVECARLLRNRYAPFDDGWSIERGSVLDSAHLKSIGLFDVVYSWGVLHHTGDMWRAMHNVTTLVKPGGTLCMAIYNDQGFASVMWRAMKRAYNRLPDRLRFLVFWPSFVRLWGPTFLRDSLRGSPLRTWSRYSRERGMSPLVDVKDWVGGYPFEVATPEQVERFCLERGFTLVNGVRRRGIGCNEFVFVRSTP